MDDDEEDRSESPDSDLTRVKQGDQSPVSSEGEVLAHATAGTLDHGEPAIAVIHSSGHPEGQESEGDDEIEADDNQASEGASDDEDDGKPLPGSESDEEKARDASLPAADCDTPQKVEEGKTPNAAIGKTDPDGATQQSTESPGPLKQSVYPHQAEFAQSEDDDDDEKFAPHLLFSQSHRLVASQIRRQLASELSVKYHEGEEEQTVVKAESPIAFPDPLPTGVAPKGVTLSDGYIMVNSSPEPPTPRQKGIIQISPQFTKH
jgi:hypothetical protein